LTPNDDYNGRTTLLTSKRCILYIYSTNIGTEYFKHGIYSPLFPLQNAVCFINLTYLVSVLFAFYIQGVLKLRKNNSGAKMLINATIHKLHGVTCHKIVVLMFADVIISRLLYLYAFIVRFLLHMHLLGPIFNLSENARKTQET